MKLKKLLNDIGFELIDNRYYLSKYINTHTEIEEKFSYFIYFRKKQIEIKRYKNIILQNNIVCNKEDVIKFIKEEFKYEFRRIKINNILK